MKQYLERVAHIIKNGTKQANRSGVNTISFPGAIQVNRCCASGNPR
ncbi:thymidylate synthase [Pseudomonas kilonensis]|nr:thymidylate synthase [Pseudomonas kilonensis]